MKKNHLQRVVHDPRGLGHVRHVAAHAHLAAAAAHVAAQRTQHAAWGRGDGCRSCRSWWVSSDGMLDGAAGALWTRSFD